MCVTRLHVQIRMISLIHHTLLGMTLSDSPCVWARIGQETLTSTPELITYMLWMAGYPNLYLVDNTPEQASSPYLFSCVDLVTLMPGLTSPCAKPFPWRCFAGALSQHLGFRNTNKPGNVPLHAAARLFSSTALWIKVVDKAQTMQD